MCNGRVRGPVGACDGVVETGGVKEGAGLEGVLPLVDSESEANDEAELLFSVLIASPSRTAKAERGR